MVSTTSLIVCVDQPLSFTVEHNAALLSDPQLSVFGSFITNKRRKPYCTRAAADVLGLSKSYTGPILKVLLNL